MSTVKIKTEPTTAATVDLKVKLEPSLSTADIKLEQHTSDIDTKVEPDSDTDSESEGDYIKSENDDDDDEDIDQFTIIPKKQRQWICEYSGCNHSFNTGSHLRMHQHEHKLQAEFNIYGKSYSLIRQSLNDRWTCPIPDCDITYKTVRVVYDHIRVTHDTTVSQQQQQELLIQMAKRKLYFHDVDDFYVNGVCCGYHITTGVFICHECRLVPECMLTHLQQKHGYDEKSIENTMLPESVVTANIDPNVNQHTSNSHLAAAISDPFKQHHQSIIQGWLCVTSDCGHCGCTGELKSNHKRKVHQGKQISTVPALVLRLAYTKKHIMCFLIHRIDQIATGRNRMNRHKLDHSHNGLNAQDEDGDDVDQNEITEVFNQTRQWKCGYYNCRRFFKTSERLAKHRREHKLETVLTLHGRVFTLARQTLDSRWPCPVPDCASKLKTIETTRIHVIDAHKTSTKQKRTNSEDDGNQQQQQIIKRRQRTFQYLKVDNFYVGVIRCGYHTTVGVFLCHECRLVPECLLTHLQQKHEYDEKSIDSSVLPDSAVNSRADPSINQHTSNPHIASSIREPYKWRNSDIIQGWLCLAPDCGYCCSAKATMNHHQYTKHKGEQISTVSALILRLLYGKKQTSGFLITRLDTATSNNAQSNSSASQKNNECNDDDGDELVLSDYSD